VTLDDLRGRATISIEEAGELLGISRGSAYQAARAGQLPTLKLGRRLLVPLRALEKLLDGEGKP
jgi:excisionase family DNA binding protein